jgi:hypothetical protein
MTGSRALFFELGVNMDEHYRTSGEKALTLESLQSLIGLKSTVYL